jgi:hypothetical protein
MRGLFCPLQEYCDMTPEAGIAEPEKTYIARQRLGKQFPAEMNTQSTIEKPLFLCNGEVITPL